MARRPKESSFKITHNYIHNPEAVERGLELWAAYLARHIAKQIIEQAHSRHQGTA